MKGDWDIKLWNLCCPPGTPVALTNDDGALEDTITRSKAWCLGDGTPVVAVEGRAGGYLLERVIPTPPFTVPNISDPRVQEAEILREMVELYKLVWLVKEV
jgi:hypothetical protein